MNHGELHAIDLIIVGVYLVSMILIGIHFVKRIKNSGDYYVAGRSFGPIVLMATVCATIIGGSGLMGRAGVAYSSGFKAVLTAIPYLLGMFLFSGQNRTKLGFAVPFAQLLTHAGGIIPARRFEAV